MGGYNYNFSSYSSVYGDETPRQTNYVQLSPLLFSGSYALLPCDQRSRVGLSIRLLPSMCRKIVIMLKGLVLQVVTRIKKLIAI